jgi:hypothetical protein
MMKIKYDNSYIFSPLALVNSDVIQYNGNKDNLIYSFKGNFSSSYFFVSVRGAAFSQTLNNAKHHESENVTVPPQIFHLLHPP